MKSYEEKQNDSGNPLNGIKPVARVRIIEVVGPRLNRNHETVDGVIDERYKYSTNFNKDYVGNRLQTLDGGVEFSWPAQRLRISVEMLQKKKAEWNNARQLMQLSQDKRPAQMNRQAGTPLPLCFNIKPMVFDPEGLIVRLFRTQKLY